MADYDQVEQLAKAYAAGQLSVQSYRKRRAQLLLGLQARPDPGQETATTSHSAKQPKTRGWGSRIVLFLGVIVLGLGVLYAFDISDVASWIGVRD